MNKNTDLHDDPNYKLHQVIEHIIRPAFKLWIEAHPDVDFIPGFYEFADQLFTKESNVQVLNITCQIDYIRQECIGAIQLGYFDHNADLSGVSTVSVVTNGSEK